jgi:CRP/FNR family transcriptional regulator
MAGRSAPLAAVPMFSLVGAQRLREVTLRSAVRTFASGAVVARGGAPARHLMVLEAGAVTAVHDTVDGRRLRLAEHRAPAAVDKVAVLDGQGWSATWVADGATRVRFVPVAEVHALIDELPAVRRHVLSQLSRRLREQQDALVRVAMGDVLMRTAHWLLAEAGLVRIEPGAAVVLDPAELQQRLGRLP